MIGRVLDEKYRILRSIGAGGMGGVYEAEQIDGGARVAVKIIHGSISDDVDDTLVSRFEREARATGALDSPHIARVFDAGVDAESYRPFMVMEYLDGEDAQQLLNRLGVVSPELALRIVAQACMGLKRAHEARIVHRDIKPANIFIARVDSEAHIVKLLDFGVAKVARPSFDGGRNSDGLTQTGTMLGSPLYMAPEQARSATLVDHRSDIWSLGMVLYRALAGRTPYQHIRGLGELVLALCSDLPPLVQYFAPWVSPQITAIVDRALRIDPNQRFQSAEEMLQAIEALLPDGSSIDAWMIEPLGEVARERVAPIFVRPAQGGPSGAVAIATNVVIDAEGAALDVQSPRTPVPRSSPGGAYFPSSMQAPISTLAPMSGSAFVPPMTTGADTVAPTTSPPPGANSFQTAAIILLSIALGGVGVYAFTRRAPASASSPDGAPPLTSAALATSAAPTGSLEPVSSAQAAVSAFATGAHAASAKPAPSSGSAERGGPVRSKEPLRLDHTRFGDRK